MIHFERIDSTNSYVLKNIDELEDGEIVIADSQTGGHGRFGREWVSRCTGNLYLTFVLKPHSYLYAANLTQYLSVVLVRVLKEYSVSANIKWPNDVLAGGGKIAGILCESSVFGGGIKGLALGIGVNLNMSGDDLCRISQKAASLNLLTGRQVNKMEFAEILSTEFFRHYSDFMETGFCFIRSEYEKYSNFLGGQIFVSDGGERFQYYAESLNDDGSLRVVDAEDCVKNLFSADIEL